MSISSEISVGFVAQAMVLAAGRGERMRPLTDATPKPLLPVRGQPLMQWPMQALARSGFTRQLVNTAWLGEQIAAHFGERALWPGLPEVQMAYSHEGRDFGRALETAGGILLPDAARDKPQQGRVLSVGDGRLLPDGTRAALEFNEGDRVVFSNYSGAEVTIDDEKLLILNSDDVLAIVR